MSEFIKICALSDLIPDAGIPALLNSQTIALFYINDQVYVLSNYDPIGQANVMSRGIVGSIKGELVVASPLYKEHYSLSTGKCLEKPEYTLKVYGVKIEGGDVWVKNL
jgi:nitrite reductase (NADH) small subunit